MGHTHDHPTTCALVQELKVLEERVADWASAKERYPNQVNTLITNVKDRIERAALIGSATAPKS